MLQNGSEIDHCVYYGMAVTHWARYSKHIVGSYLLDECRRREGHFFGNTIYTQTKRNANLVESDRVQTG